MKHLKLFEDFNLSPELAVEIINAHRNGDKIFQELENNFGNLVEHYEQGMNKQMVIYTDDLEKSKEDGHWVMVYEKELKVAFIYFRYYNKIHKFKFESNKIERLCHEHDYPFNHKF